MDIFWNKTNFMLEMVLVQVCVRWLPCLIWPQTKSLWRERVAFRGRGWPFRGERCRGVFALCKHVTILQSDSSNIPWDQLFNYTTHTYTLAGSKEGKTIQTSFTQGLQQCAMPCVPGIQCITRQGSWKLYEYIYKYISFYISLIFQCGIFVWCGELEIKYTVWRVIFFP